MVTTIYHGEANNLINKLDNGSVNLIITSPPYNIGKEYEKEIYLGDYLRQQEITIVELLKKLSPNGSICWQIGNYINKGEVFPLDVYFYDIFKDHGLFLRNRIVWHYEHGLHASLRLSGRYETILWFTKSSKNYTFNLDPIRVPSKYPGKRHYKGPNIGKPSGNPLGKNPSDVWDIPNVKANHPEKTAHPCQFPVELAERCILAFTNEGDTVLDPYMGVGSSLIAAQLHNRNSIGFEKEQQYIDIANERLDKLEKGILKLRSMNTPIHVPTGKEKISQRPQEWNTNG